MDGGQATGGEGGGRLLFPHASLLLFQTTSPLSLSPHVASLLTTSLLPHLLILKSSTLCTPLSFLLHATFYPKTLTCHHLPLQKQPFLTLLSISTATYRGRKGQNRRKEEKEQKACVASGRALQCDLGSGGWKACASVYTPPHAMPVCPCLACLPSLPYLCLPGPATYMLPEIPHMPSHCSNSSREKKEAQLGQLFCLPAFSSLLPILHHLPAPSAALPAAVSLKH